MKTHILTFCLTIAILLGSVEMSFSADLQKGKAVRDSGDCATALKEFQPLAENKGILSFSYSKEDVIEAQHFLGGMYTDGCGVPKDHKTAVKWLTLAAEQGNVDSQLELGIAYSQEAADFDGPKDYKTAVKWFRLAAEQGNIYAQYFLGSMYKSGKGVVQYDVYAHMWWDIAALSGYDFSFLGGNIDELRASLAKNMNPADLSKAKALAIECVRKKYKGCEDRP